MVSYERVGVQKVKLFSATDCGEVGEDEDWDKDSEMSVNKWRTFWSKTKGSSLPQWTSYAHE